MTAQEAERVARLFPSFRDFVDDALFHPAWGYYSTGRVRLGDGGHYDTFPIALSPLFGRMLAQYAYRFWRRAGAPRRFEICEIGAGNGQLCLDTVLWISRRAGRQAGWRRFEAAARYRIIERSPALVARQRQQLGELARRVVWTRADLSRRGASRAPFADCGLVFANEVLDCLAHHKIVVQADGTPGVVFVIPALLPDAPAAAGGLRLVFANGIGRRAVAHARLAAALGDDGWRRHVSFHEVVLPLGAVPRLEAFLRRHCAELFRGARSRPPYFACPAIEPLVANAARLYRACEVLWIDYGELRSFHRRAAEGKRVFAGPPRSGASLYRAPGWDDITFLVDFSVVAQAAAKAGLRVAFYGGQGELARRSGVVLDQRAAELILRQRVLRWMLAVAGVGPDRDWACRSLTWGERAGTAGRVERDVARGIDEFLGRRRSPFKLMILRPGDGRGKRPGRRGEGRS